jgi:8-oxo-dGTP diphosphatase
VLHVAVGVVRNASGEILISLRPDHVHQGGLWEFPGGKVEPGEDVLIALGRELNEELGIEVRRAQPLLEVTHDYGDKAVRLDVWLVEDFAGEASGREGQPLRWCEPSVLRQYPFPEANLPILEACEALPAR